MKWIVTTVIFFGCILVVASIQRRIEPLDLYQFSAADACKAAIGLYNNRDPKTMRVSSVLKGESTISYRRDDGKHFVYDCRISGTRLHWNTRQGSGPNTYADLSVDPADGGTLTVVLMDNKTEQGRETYSRSDLH